MRYLFFVALLAGPIGLCSLTAGECVRPSHADDDKKSHQNREEKTEQFPASLAERCQKMLEMQIAVHDDTKALHKVVQGNADKKPRPKDKEISAKLAEKQKAIVVDATKTIAMLQGEGTATAFPEVFIELRSDMKRVQSRLDMCEVGMPTQAIEGDIIDTLKEIIRALKTSR
jgi:hypothetical protein